VGGEAFPADRAFIATGRLLLLVHFQEKSNFFKPLQAQSPPPLTPPHEGEGSGETLPQIRRIAAGGVRTCCESDSPLKRQTGYLTIRL
jgi:hypothetical protein